jgi:hypothetical protein
LRSQRGGNKLVPLRWECPSRKAGGEFMPRPGFGPHHLPLVTSLRALDGLWVELSLRLVSVKVSIKASRRASDQPVVASQPCCEARRGFSRLSEMRGCLLRAFGVDPGPIRTGAKASGKGMLPMWRRTSTPSRRPPVSSGPPRGPQGVSAMASPFALFPLSRRSVQR